MSNAELWIKVENAKCELEQLDSLMQLHNGTYLDVSAEEFCMMAKINYADMNNIATLMLTVLHRAEAELAEAITQAFHLINNQRKEVQA